MTAREVLDGIKARLTAATPGPWEESYGDVVQSFELAVQTGEHEHERVGIVPGEYVRFDDATFIAAAPTDVARLVAAVEGVLGLHKEVEGYIFGAVPGATPDYPVCSTCFTEDERPAPYPCPTVAAVEAALKEGE